MNSKLLGMASDFFFFFLTVLCISCRTSLSSCRLSCFAECGILVPGPGIKPTSSALQGVFLTTGPLGSLHIRTFYGLSLAWTISGSPSCLSWTPCHQNHLRVPGKAYTSRCLEKCSLVLYSTPCITMHRGRMWYTPMIMCVDRHTPEQKIWTSVSALSQHLRKLDLPTCQSHQNFTCLVDHMPLSHMSLFSHWEFYIKTVNK